MSETLSEPTWQYLGSMTPGQETVLWSGHEMTPEPVDVLPEEPTRGTLVAVLQDPGTGLRWAMLFG